jgi:DNA-binding MarR family transcriptional regulator
MALKEELGFPNDIATRAHETLLNVFVTANLLVKEADRVLKPFGITEAQFDILMLLEHQAPDGSADQSTLGRMLVVNRSNVTGLIDRMERDGLVKRTADPGDRRVNRVRMTPEGMKVLHKAEQAYVLRTREVVSSLSAADQETLCRMLETVRASTRRKSNPRKA